MRLLIITPFYAPDLGPSAPLFALLSEALVRKGHRVCVVAAVPHYPSGRVSSDFRGVGNRHSNVNGVKVTRVPVPSIDRSKFKQRAFQLICFQIGAVWASLFLKYDAALITNPALETWLPTWWHAAVRRKPVIYSVFDVYPDVGVNLGVFRSKRIIEFVRRLECACLGWSRCVQIISDNFRPSLSALGVPEEKMVRIPIWVDDQLIRPQPGKNSFSHEFALDGKFVVLYAGNIGISQGLETVLQAAKLLNDAAFVFVGDGSGKTALQAEAEKLDLHNVQFIPFQPRERLPEILASADVSLIVLKSKIGLDSLPSKTYSCLASGRPVIASVDKESELYRLVEEAHAGLCVPPEDPTSLAKAILKLKGDEGLCGSLGANGRRYVEQNHSVVAAADQFEHLFEQLVSPHKNDFVLQMD